MGDLLGCPRVAPLFLSIMGYHSGLPLVVPKGSALPIAIGAGRSSIRSPSCKIRAVKIARLVRGRSHRLRTIGGNDRLFGRLRRMLWVETLGVGDGSPKGSVRTCFRRR